DSAVWIWKHDRAAYRRRMKQSEGMRPLRGCSIPQPRVSLGSVSCSVPAEKHHFVSDTVVRHLAIRTRRRRGMRHDLGPRNAIECPRVLQINTPRPIEATKHDYFAAVWSYVIARYERAGGEVAGES